MSKKFPMLASPRLYLGIFFQIYEFDAFSYAKTAKTHIKDGQWNQTRKQTFVIFQVSVWTTPCSPARHPKIMDLIIC